MASTWYLVADGATSYLVYGDTASTAGTHGSLTPPATLDVYDSASGGTWSYVAGGIDGWGSPTGYYTLTLSSAPAGATPTNGTTVYGNYDPLFGATRYVSPTGRAYYVPGDTTFIDYGGRTPINIGQGADPVSGDSWYYDFYDFTGVTQRILVLEPGSGTVTPTYPRYDQTAGGSFYQAVGGAIYLVAGDTTASAHAGLTLPGAFPAIDPVTGGTWTLSNAGYAVLTIGGTGGGTYPRYDAALGGTFYRVAGSGESYLVVGDTDVDQVDWNFLTPPGVYPSAYTIDLGQYGGVITIGTWYADPAGYAKLVLGDLTGTGGGGTPTYPYLDNAGGGHALPHARARAAPRDRRSVGRQSALCQPHAPRGPATIRLGPRGNVVLERRAAVRSGRSHRGLSAILRRRIGGPLQGSRQPGVLPLPRRYCCRSHARGALAPHHIPPARCRAGRNLGAERDLSRLFLHHLHPRSVVSVLRP